MIGPSVPSVVVVRVLEGGRGFACPEVHQETSHVPEVTLTNNLVDSYLVPEITALLDLNTV